MHLKKTVSLIALALCVAGAFGCKQGAKTEGGGSKGAVLAEVNGAKITDADFYKELETLPPYLKPMTETPEGKKEMLDTMVVRELILQQAEKDGVDKSPQVAQKLEELKKRVVVEAFLKKKVEEMAKVSDDDLKAYYEKNKEKFKTGDQIRASHILVKSADEAKAVQKDLQGGADFAAEAKKHSIDGAAQKGGDLGWFGKGSMLPDFENVAFSLKEGQTSGIVQTKFGYHIIKLTGKRGAGARSFEEVKDQLKQALLPEKQQEAFKKLKEEMKKGAKLNVHEDALKGLKNKGPEEAKAQPEKP